MLESIFWTVYLIVIVAILFRASVKNPAGFKSFLSGMFKGAFLGGLALWFFRDKED